MIESPAKVQMWEGIIETLSKQRIERLRPFVEARNPGDSNDPGTPAFQDMRSEAEGLIWKFSAFRSVSLLPVSRAHWQLFGPAVGECYLPAPLSVTYECLPCEFALLEESVGLVRAKHDRAERA